MDIILGWMKYMAILRFKLRSLDKKISQRNIIADFYKENIISKFLTSIPVPPSAKLSHYLIPFLCKDKEI